MSGDPKVQGDDSSCLKIHDLQGELDIKVRRPGDVRQLPLAHFPHHFGMLLLKKKRNTLCNSCKDCGLFLKFQRRVNTFLLFLVLVLLLSRLLAFRKTFKQPY